MDILKFGSRLKGVLLITRERARQLGLVRAAAAVTRLSLLQKVLFVASILSGYG